jgi:hypothetical protein
MQGDQAIISKPRAVGCGRHAAMPVGLTAPLVDARALSLKQPGKDHSLSIIGNDRVTALIDR